MSVFWIFAGVAAILLGLLALVKGVSHYNEGIRDELENPHPGHHELNVQKLKEGRSVIFLFFVLMMVGGGLLVARGIVPQ